MIFLLFPIHIRLLALVDQVSYILVHIKQIPYNSLILITIQISDNIVVGNYQLCIELCRCLIPFYLHIGERVNNESE